MRRNSRKVPLWSLQGNFFPLLEASLFGRDAVEKVDPDSTGAFPKDRLGQRQKFMFNAIKHIWYNAGINGASQK